MGAWGVTARESDTGLNYLGIVEDRIFKKSGYKYFNVKEITELLSRYIIDEVKTINKGCPEENMDDYVQVAFPYRYGNAVILISECLVEYFDNGELALDFYKAGEKEPSVIKITDFIYTRDDLSHLLSELQNMLNPNHGLYVAWKDSDYFDEWQSHIKALSDNLKNQMKIA